MRGLDREFPGACIVLAQGDKDELVALVLGQGRGGNDQASGPVWRALSLFGKADGRISRAYRFVKPRQVSRKIHGKARYLS